MFGLVAVIDDDLYAFRAQACGNTWDGSSPRLLDRCRWRIEVSYQVVDDASQRTREGRQDATVRRDKT
jgi:hypothetical protein